MVKRYRKNQSDSPFFMYVIAFIMFILLSFTIISFMHDDKSSLYINFDKTIVDANIKAQDEIKVRDNIQVRDNIKAKDEIKARKRQEDFIDKAMSKMGDDVKYSKYQEAYNKYQADKLKQRMKEIEYRKALNRRLTELERQEQLAKLQNEKLAKMRERLKHPQTNVMDNTPQEIPKQEQDTPEIPEQKIIQKALQNSSCTKDSATAVAYFFHPNNSQPIELIFNNPSPNYNNNGNIKLVFGDLPREKQHILKRNMLNLNQLLNKPKYMTSANPEHRQDIALKVMSGVTTSCSPYVYQSKDFYLSTIPPSMQNAQTKESYCKSQNTRLPDPIELIPILLTGRLPSGLYWTSSKVYKMAPNKTVVTRGNLIMTQSTMLVDYANFSIGFVSQEEYDGNLMAYSVCVLDK